MIPSFPIMKRFPVSPWWTKRGSPSSLAVQVDSFFIVVECWHPRRAYVTSVFRFLKVVSKGVGSIAPFSFFLCSLRALSNVIIFSWLKESYLPLLFSSWALFSPLFWRISPKSKSRVSPTAPTFPNCFSHDPKVLKIWFKFNFFILSWISPDQFLFPSPLFLNVPPPKKRCGWPGSLSSFRPNWDFPWS